MLRCRATWFGPQDIPNTGDGHSTGVKGEGNGFGGWGEILQGRCAFTIPISDGAAIKDVTSSPIVGQIVVLVHYNIF
jgi:hypothetical protein